MLAIIFGVLLILGGIGWTLLVIFVAGMADRQTGFSDTAPALFGVAAIVVGIIVLIWG